MANEGGPESPEHRQAPHGFCGGRVDRTKQGSSGSKQRRTGLALDRNRSGSSPFLAASGRRKRAAPKQQCRCLNSPSDAGQGHFVDVRQPRGKHRSADLPPGSTHGPFPSWIYPPMLPLAYRPFFRVLMGKVLRQGGGDARGMGPLPGRFLYSTFHLYNESAIKRRIDRTRSTPFGGPGPIRPGAAILARPALGEANV